MKTAILLLSIVLCITNISVAQILTDSLIAYYPFNGNANDESGNEHHGLINGATLTSDIKGNENGAFLFNGVDDFIQISYDSVFNIKPPFSFSAWINPNNLTSSKPNALFVVLCQSAPSWDEIYSLGVKEGVIMSGHFGVLRSIPLNEWTLITVTMTTDSLISFYKNDQNIASIYDKNIVLINGEYNSDVFIGKDENNYHNNFDGKIDDIRIYNRALTANEIYKLYGDSTITSFQNHNISLLTKIKLYQNYPNPFNPSTAIRYSLPQRGFVQLKVYDILGMEVANLVNKEQVIGNYKVEFNSSKLASGIYFYRIYVNDFVQTKKMILLR